MAFWWIAGGMLVLVGAVVLRDKQTRHKVLRAFARRWEKGRKRSAKGKARAHLQTRRASARALPQAQPRYHRPKRPRLLATKCTAACRTSKKPAFDRKTGRLLCDCPCGGREHGMYRKGSTSGPRVANKTAVGTSGTKRAAASASTPKPAAPARPTATPAPAAPKTETPPAPKRRAATAAPKTERTKPVQTPTAKPQRPPAASKKSAPAKPRLMGPARVPPVPPEKVPNWSWEAMVKHVQSSPQCSGARFRITLKGERAIQCYRCRQVDWCGDWAAD